MEVLVERVAGFGVHKDQANLTQFRKTLVGVRFAFCAWHGPPMMTNSGRTFTSRKFRRGDRGGR